jgi:hypothetical protein
MYDDVTARRMPGQGPPKVFGLIHPGHSGLPYVAETEPDGLVLFGLCRHHSHFYRLLVDLSRCELVQFSNRTRDVPAPMSVLLNDTLIDSVRRVIDSNQFTNLFRSPIETPPDPSHGQADRVP